MTSGDIFLSIMVVSAFAYAGWEIYCDRRWPKGGGR
jgi:hypothetical protein